MPSQISLTQHLLELEQQMRLEHGPPEASWVERRLLAVISALDIGRHGQAMGYALKALELATALNDLGRQARSHTCMALIYSDTYDLANAERHFGLARQLALTPPADQTAPDPATLARVTINLAHHLLHGRAYQEAYQALIAEAGLFAVLGDEVLLVVYHVNMITACTRLHAQRLQDEGLDTQGKEESDLRDPDQWQIQVARSVQRLEQVPQQALSVSTRLDILDCFAQAALLRGEPQQALIYARQRTLLARQADSPLLLGSAYRQLGQVWQAQHNWSAAIEAFSAALNIYGEGQQPVFELELREELAAAHASDGDFRAAYAVQRGNGQSGLMMEQILRQRAQIGEVERQVMEADWRATTYREAAERDHLTGVANRAKAVDLLGSLQQSLDSGEVQEAAVAIFDLDHFKEVNDRYGHDVGDQVLIGVARQVQGAIRDQDRLSRHGGEEFLLILRETSPVEALRICDRLRLEIEGLRLPSWPELRITASFGIGAMQPGLGVQDALRMADAQLYRSKRAGRNRVSGLGEEDAPGTDGNDKNSPPARQGV